jgi:hypothetical protein
VLDVELVPLPVPLEPDELTLPELAAPLELPEEPVPPSGL